MARRCQITGKGPKTGNNRSHSMRATKRRFLPNLITKRIFDPVTKKFVKVKMAASTLRTLLKQDRKLNKKKKEAKAK
jgi:large subunit ribosomal protein L28